MPLLRQVICLRAATVTMYLDRTNSKESIPYDYEHQGLGKY